MNRFTLFGIVILAASGVTIIFEAVSSMMTIGEIVLVHVTLEGFFGVDAFYWIDNLPWDPLIKSADWLIQVPIYLMCAVIGVVFLIIGGFTAR